MEDHPFTITADLQLNWPCGFRSNNFLILSNQAQKLPLMTKYFVQTKQNEEFV